MSILGKNGPGGGAPDARCDDDGGVCGGATMRNNIINYYCPVFVVRVQTWAWTINSATATAAALRVLIICPMCRCCRQNVRACEA